MRIAVICAMAEEALAIRNMLKDPSSENVCGVKLTKGYFKEHEVLLSISGVGKSCAAATTQLIICRYNPENLLNIGLAGSCSPGLPLSGVVVANSLLYHDFDMDIAAAQPPYLSVFTPDPVLQSRAVAACESLNIPFRVGIVATGDQFIEDENVKNNIIARTGCACVEMEAAAIAHIAHKNNTPYVTIKVLSDQASEGALTDFQEVFSLGAYCERSAAIIKEIITNL